MLKRVFRFLLTLLLAVLAVALTIVLVLYFNRDWQRDLVDTLLEDRTGLQWSLGEAYFERPHRFRAQNVFALKDAEGVEVQSVDLQFDLGRSFGTDEIVLTGGSLHQLRLDLSNLPAEAFGLSELQLARGMPTRAQTLQAVHDLTEFALMRLEAAGLSVELNGVQVDGLVLLPGGRQLQFAEIIQHARSADTANMRLEIQSAEFK